MIDAKMIRFKEDHSLSGESLVLLNEITVIFPEIRAFRTRHNGTFYVREEDWSRVQEAVLRYYGEEK